MRRVCMILLVSLGGWLVRPGPTIVAQEAATGFQRLPYQDTSESLLDLPTPQLFRLEVEFSAEGISAVRIPRDPAWVAATEPVLRLEQSQVERETTTQVTLLREQEGENFKRALEQALDRRPTDGTPTP